MTWEEIIIDIRTKPEYADLVKYAYFEEKLQLNVDRFINSSEFLETLSLLKKYDKIATSELLDVGAGNGISTIGFALNGYKVTAVEPDKSHTIGAGAIQKLVSEYNLKEVTIVSSFAEKMPFPDNKFDVVYVRQAMHHAYHLNDFISEIARVLKPGGILFTVRDHVINDENGKQEFLKIHPLHRFYGGENAFTLYEYRNAFIKANLTIKEEMKPLDTPINYFPTNRSNAWRVPLPNFLFKVYLQWLKLRTNHLINQPGRLYSFIAVK